MSSGYFILSNGQYKYRIECNKNDSVASLISKLKYYYSPQENNDLILIYGTTPLEASKRISDYNIEYGKRIKFSEEYNGGLNIFNNFI